MKFFGYHTKKQERPSELLEATIAASPKRLREIARFISDAAAEMEKSKEFNHVHLQDRLKLTDEEPDLIVSCEVVKGKK